MDENTIKQVWLLRRMVAMIDSNSVSFTEAMERVIERLRKTKTNAEFLDTLTKEV